VIVRGTGTADGQHDAAAVCIFESHTPNHERQSQAPSLNVHGIARLVQVGDTIILDLSVRYDKFRGSNQIAYIAQTGDISEGAQSTGGVLRTLGQIDMSGDDKGSGDLFIELKGFKLWEVIGRAIVIAPIIESGSSPKLGKGLLAGVIARSAGAWGTSSANDKTVCSCSGLTMWEEAKLQSDL